MGVGELGCKLIALMALCVYVGNAVKDLVSAPRPLGIEKGKAKLIFGSYEADAVVNSLVSR